MNGARERLLAGLVLAVFAAVFAWLNGAAQVDLNLGLFRIRSVPLPVIVFGAFLMGMLTLFLASLKAELRTQRMLRRYREELGGQAEVPRGTTPSHDPDPAPDEI